MIYRKLRKIVLGTLACLSVFAFCAACSGETSGAIPKDEVYEYNTNEPFYSEPDAFMVLDGKFEEEQWQDCKWLECSRVDDPTKLKMTTRFTPAGLYVGVIAYNTNIIWQGKHNYPVNSNFYLQIAKEDEPHYGSYPIYNHPMRDAIFYADAKNSLSLRETQYACGTYCDGELNSGNTKSLSMELFVSWEDLHYTQEELGMSGMPNAVRIFCKFMHPVSVYHGFIDQGAYSTYYAFGKNGVLVDYNSKYLGHAIDGESAFGDWLFDDENKKIYSTTTKTQTVWFKQDDLGNAKSTANDYIAEVTVRGVEGQTGQYAGLMSMQSKTEFCFYTVHVPSVKNGKISVRTGMAMDGSGWMSDFRLNKTVVESGYQKDSVKLTVVKKGGDFYYFCNGVYVASDYIGKIANKNVVGFYANGAAEFSEWSFQDYTGDTQTLDAYLAEHLYFVSYEMQGSGAITTNRLAVPKSEGTVDITAIANAGYVLTDLLANGESIFEEYMQNAVDFTYRYTIGGNTNLKAVFTKMGKNDVQTVYFTFKNANGAQLKALDCDVKLLNENPLLCANLQLNTSGVVIADLLKSGENYQIGGREVDCNGTYTVCIQAAGYHDKEYSFTLDPAITDYEITLDPVNWGALELNGATTSTSGTMQLYDAQKGVYGTNTNATVKQYLLDSKTSEPYVVKATVSVAEKTGNGNVVGAMLSSGGSCYILLKSCSWETNKLCVEVYDKANTSAEISITGFAHSLGVVGGELSFTTVRLGDKIFVCNEKGEMAFYMDKEGVHLQGDFKFGSSSKLAGVNKGLADFFEKGDENGVGMVQYHTQGGAYWFNIAVEKGEEKVFDFFQVASLQFQAETQDYQASVSGVLPLGENKYAKNTGLTLTATSKVSGKIVKAIKLVYKDSEQIVIGAYDPALNITTFDFLIKGDCTVQMLLGAEENVISQVTLNGTPAHEEGKAIYDAQSNRYGVDSTSTVWNYYADSKTDGDFAFTTTITVAEKTGFGHILGTCISAGGYSYIAFNGCSWETNKLVLSVRNGGTNTAKEVLISGFAHTLGVVGGTLTITVVKLDGVFYVYNANGALGFTMDKQNGLQLQNGFTTSADASTIAALNENLVAFYGLGNENALGFVSWKNGTGKYWFDLQMQKGKEAMSTQFNQVCKLTFAQSSSYQVQGLTASDPVQVCAKGATITVLVESFLENKKAKTLEITFANGEKEYIFGEYDAQTKITAFTFTVQNSGAIEIALDDTHNIISGSGFELGKDKEWAENPWEGATNGGGNQ